MAGLGRVGSLCALLLQGKRVRAKARREQGAPLPPPLAHWIVIAHGKSDGSLFVSFLFFFVERENELAPDESRPPFHRQGNWEPISSGDERAVPWQRGTPCGSSCSGRRGRPSTRRSLAENNQADRPGRRRQPTGWSKVQRPALRRARVPCPPPSNHSLRSDPILLAY
jgi:hypothetical protein